MASAEDELREMKQRNNDLAQKVQYWKMLAGQREKEKLKLMKEINELRLKLGRIRSNANIQANNLKSALQATAQKALAHLVKASAEIASSIELAKNYNTDTEDLNESSLCWGSLNSSPIANKDKVNRVPPLMLGGRSIQPVVALTMLDTSNARSASRSSNLNRSVTERAVPMHMLQDVYIPLTRIDIDPQSQNMETEETNNADDSEQLLELDDNEGEGVIEESQRIDEEDEFDSSRILDAVSEETEPENDEETPKRSSKRADNPLEGPSWMLDAVTNNNEVCCCQPAARGGALEPDSTTEPEPGAEPGAEPCGDHAMLVPVPRASRLSRECSPTVRRRKRASSPPPAATPRRASIYSPRARASCSSGRVLKVVVSKMLLEDSPARAAPPASHAPSPNGATVATVVVSQTNQADIEMAAGEPSPYAHRQTTHAHEDTNWSDERKLKRTDRHKPVLQDLHLEQLHINTDRRKRDFDSSDSCHRTTEQVNVDDNDCVPQVKEKVKRGRGASADRSRTERRHKGASERDSENRLERPDSRASNDSRDDTRAGSCESDSGSGGERDGRSRRTRSVVTYKEKPLNRKMRR